MAKDPSEPSNRGYKISEGPVTSSLSRRKDEAREEFTELPSHYGKPLLVAIARDPRPEQCLLIARRFYDAIGGHSAGDDAEAAILRRLGRQRLVVLPATITVPNT